MIFPSVLVKAWLMLIQNNIYCWIETTQIEIEESPQSKFYNIIGDLSIRLFWYHSSSTKRNPWVMLCPHCPINDSQGYLHNTIYLAVMLQASWHTAEVNEESKGSYIRSWWIGKTSLHQLWHRSQDFPEREQSSRTFPLPQSSFLRTIYLLFFK